MQTKGTMTPDYEDYVTAIRGIISTKELGTLPRVVVVVGPSSFLHYKAFNVISKHWVKADLGVAHSVEATELDQRDFYNLWAQTSLFESSSLYLVRRACGVKNFASWLSAIPSSSAIRSYLVLDGGEKLAADVQKQVSRLGGMIVPCHEPRGTAGYMKVAASIVRRYQLNVTDDGLALLIDSTGHDLGKIENELAKLALQFAGSSERVTRSDIAVSVGSLREDDVFELFKLLKDRKAAKAHLMTEAFLNRGESAIAMNGIFARYSREQLERGSRTLGLAGVRACADADRKLKSTSIDEAVVLGNVIEALSEV